METLWPKAALVHPIYCSASDADDLASFDAYVNAAAVAMGARQHSK